MDYIKGTFGVVGATIIIILVLLIIPFLLFWSIQTLFRFEIPFTFWDVLAGYVLLALVRGGK